MKWDKLRKLVLQDAILSRATVLEITKTEGPGVVVHLHMSRPDWADFAWALSGSAEEPPGAWTMPQVEVRDD